MRLDQAVAARHPEISRRKARELISERRVLVNDRPVGAASREVADSDRITIIEAVPEIVVLRETPEWLAVNKPAGIPTQPPRDRSHRSLEELLRVQYRNLFVVHRIDTGTSGVVLFAKTREAAAQLSELFASRTIRKTYLAVISGVIDSEITIDSPIEGKDAVTVVRPVRASLVEADLHTGRMHQIRVHFASIGHPVVGDRRYGGVSAPRLMLHAWRIAHESFGVIEAPVPSDFQSCGPMPPM